MNVLGVPIDLPARVVSRAVSDLGDLARAAQQVPDRLDAMDARAQAIEAQLDRALEVAEEIDRRVGAVLDIGERMDQRAAAILEMGERMDAHATAMLDLGERLLAVGETANGHAVVVAERAEQVATRGAEVAAALPTLERAVALAEPLEGAVERLGRIVDRLPGSRSGRDQED
jgi:methyl-accepting chemotaxis protein